MGMKANSNNFKRTKGAIKYNLKIQYFGSKKLPLKARLYLKVVKNEKLRNTILALFRPGAHIGDGSTTAAIKYQIKFNKYVNGKDHIIKGKERVANLEHILKKTTLTASENKIAKKLLKDLKKALKGK